MSDNPGHLLSTHLVMSKSHPTQQVFRYSEDVSQDVDFEFIKRLVNRRLEQCLKLMQPVLNLQSRLRVVDIAVCISVRNGRRVVGVAKTQALGGRRQQTRFKAGDSLIDEVVDGIDDIVYQGLSFSSLPLATIVLFSFSFLLLIVVAHPARGD